MNTPCHPATIIRLPAPLATVAEMAEKTPPDWQMLQVRDLLGREWLVCLPLAALKQDEA